MSLLEKGVVLGIFLGPWSRPFLVACDTLARTVMPPAELPVGILTSLLGGPFFLWLLLARSPQGEVV